MMTTKQVILPEEAPFSPEQREWLNGYLTALLAPFAEEDSAPGVPVTIAWGSQTGSAETLAKKFAKVATKAGVDPTVVDLAQFDHGSISELEHLVLVTSTYGAGDPPDNAQAFYDFITSDEAPQLNELNYAVLALGDSAYPDFCQAGIDFDNRFKQLGATPILERVELDVDYDDDYAKWSSDLLEVFGSTAVASDDDQEVEQGVTKKNPYTAEIIKQYNLNDPSSVRETTHVEISLKDSGVAYSAGDALGVFPVNDPDLVDDLLQVLGFAPDAEVAGKALRDALLEDYEIRNLTPPVFKTLAENSENAELSGLLADDRKKELSDFLWGLEIFDVIKDYAIRFESPEAFLQVLKPLAPRLYSIASSPKAHPDEVHLTVGAVKYNSKERVRKGVCSTYFSERTMLASPRVFVHENNAFRPPANPASPMIMVGPGTGIAPFRAFLEERQATAAEGKNWLFFGNPYRSLDFLYQEQLQEIQQEGYLQKLSLAFSRDQEEKLYVQHLMMEEAEELFQWIQNDGHFYVCGDASKMAKDVDDALHRVIETCGDMSEEEARNYVTQMKADKRYARDVY
ncbi:MAG: sulfite reductase subunit alpha [Planctomycetota bacterium]